MFKCNICNDIYYGKTKLHFKVRALEHLGVTPLSGKFDHIYHTGHNASFDYFETVVKKNLYSFSEPLLILLDDPPLNSCVKLIPLELFVKLFII